MPTKLLLACVSIAGLLLTAGTADAQIVTVQANYTAGNPGTAKPSGTYSVPAGNPRPPYQIVCDYGTIANGTFTVWAGGPGETATALNPGAGGGPFSWSQANAVNITNPPASLYVRARLQSWVTAQNRWYTESTSYAPITPAPPGGD